jgi:hypothetical protein
MKATIDLPPGIVREDTDRRVLNRWKDCDKVRFRNGMPRKLGGWIDQNITHSGVTRKFLAWDTLDSLNILAIATHKKLYLWSGGAISNITPFRLSTDAPFSDPALTDPFDTVNTSQIVTVNHTSHGCIDGDTVYYDGASPVGGITIDGEYEVTLVDADSFTIVHSVAATSTVNGGGGSVNYDYEINIGAEHQTLGLGFGAGPFNGSTWGTARTLSDIIINARIWSLAVWGEDLIANPIGGGIYHWDASAGSPFAQRAAILSAAPSTARFAAVSPLDRHLIALGAHDGANDDPMLVAWCDQEDFTDWTATSVNTAGTRRLDAGTKLIAGSHTRRETVLFTDSALYSMGFIGPPNTFGFNLISAKVSIAGPLAFTVYDDRVWFMARNDFYVYDGIARVLPCDVRSFVFDDINTSQLRKVVCSTNRKFQEIWWFYPSSGSFENDRYVVYNKEEGVWYIGNIERTAFIDDEEVLSSPFGASSSKIYAHEIGCDDDGDPMTAYLESYDVESGEEGFGSTHVRTEKVIPDFKRLNGSINLTFKCRKYPQSPQYTKGPKTIFSDTEKLGLRARARQISLYLESHDLGDDWIYGSLDVEFMPHGRK